MSKPDICDYILALTLSIILAWLLICFIDWTAKQRRQYDTFGDIQLPMIHFVEHQARR